MKNTISEEQVYVMSTQQERNETQVWAEALMWMTMTRQSSTEMQREQDG